MLQLYVVWLLNTFLFTLAKLSHVCRTSAGAAALCAVFAAFFAAVAVYNRLDFTITRDEKWQESQAHDKALGLIQQLTEFWDSECPCCCCCW
jgi:hypothetical protein